MKKPLDDRTDLHINLDGGVLRYTDQAGPRCCVCCAHLTDKRDMLTF